MDLIIVTPIRLFGEALVAYLRQQDDLSPPQVCSDLHALRGLLQRTRADVALIDVTQGTELDAVRCLAMQFPDVALVALGLPEQRQPIIRCGRAGFRGYIERDGSMEQLRKTLTDVVAGRLTCSAEISGGLLRALFLRDAEPAAAQPTEALTQREGEVLQLIGEGLSNKEIATALSLSIATVKHHVHNVLHKLNLARRAQAMRRVREAPWIAASPLTSPGRRSI